jgi:hypothetical protein
VYEEAFAGCNSLTIYCEAQSQPSGWASNWNPDNRPVVWGYVAQPEYTEGLTFSLINNDTEYEVSGYMGSETNVVIPKVYNGKPVTRIGYEAFAWKSLKSVVIGGNVTSVSAHAFYYCESLESVTIPNSVMSIGDRAFIVCESLTNVTYLGTIDEWVQIQFAYCGNPLHYAENLYVNGQLVTVANLTSATKISSFAFVNYSTLISVEFGDSVTSIDDSAFSGCSSLTSVVMNNNVTSIGKYTFSKCISLTGIEIPDSVTSIGEEAFSYCSSLTIYCEAQSQPSGWASDWNYSNRPVVWDCLNKVINFTISGESYQAIKGMTWEQWLESEYNVNNYSVILLDNVQTVFLGDAPTLSAYGLSYNNVFVPITDTIVEGRTYVEKLGTHLGGSN